MKRYIYIILVLLLAWFYWEWSFHRAYNLKLTESTNGTMMVTAFLNGKELIPTNPNSNIERQRAIKDLLMQNAGNWELTFASYKPYLKLKAKGLDINITDAGVILNIEISKSQWRQYKTKSNKISFQDYLNRVK